MTSETLAALERKIRAALPALAFRHAELNDYGDDNRIVVLDGHWVVRIPRNDEYRARFAAELNLLDALSGHAPVPVPAYEHIAADKSLGAYRLIDGREMTPPVFDALPVLAKNNVLTSLGRFLTVLHRLPAETIGQPDGHIPEAWHGPQFTMLYRALRRASLAERVDAQWLARFDAFHDAFALETAGPPRLVHHDISDDHILIAGNTVAGIIDFSDAAFGESAIDFAWFWRLGEREVDTVLEAYDKADDGLRSRSRWTYVRFVINQISHGDKAKWKLSIDALLAELAPHLKILGF
ncbi:MAG: phosphotransferase [Proteobacteria bacterium]|nr:phosphotransferase [Pseudomonadota bacterium]